MGQLGGSADLGQARLVLARLLQVFQSFCCLVSCGGEGETELVWDGLGRVSKAAVSSGDRITWSLILQQGQLFTWGQQVSKRTIRGRQA